MPRFATLRQRRHVWGGLLLGVLLALLPLRGWAWATMQLAAPAPSSAVSMVPVPPCHAAVAEPDGALPDDAASGCLLCALCHGADLCQRAPGVAPVAGLTTAPAAGPQGHSPPALPLPERPPRA